MRKEIDMIELYKYDEIVAAKDEEIVNQKKQEKIKLVEIFAALSNAKFSTSCLFNAVKKIHSLTVPCNGIYHFIVCGAQGIDGHEYNNAKCKGGTGAIIKCNIVLKQGDILDILCGHQNEACGGGGGSFISINGKQHPLIVAGGGGCDWNGKIQYDASLTEDGGSIETSNGGTKGGKGQSNASIITMKAQDILKMHQKHSVL